MQNNNNEQLSILLKSALYGSITAFASLPLQHPFDALKTNMQSNQTKFSATIKEMLRRKGWRAFYNGFSVNSARVMLKQAYRWPLWISISSFYRRLMPNTNQLVRQSIIGFSISCCQLLVICPFQRLKTWLMTTVTQQQTKIRNYFQLNKGILQLYAGFTPMLARQGLSWASFLGASQIFKKMMRQYRGGVQILTSTDLFLVSIPVAFINTLFIMPVDCIKTFYQNYEGSALKERLRFFKFVKQSLKRYHLRGLYLGWQARIIQYMIQSAFTLIVIEELHYDYDKAVKFNNDE